MIVRRGDDPGPFANHRDYVVFLRDVFNYRCAYCLTPDNRLGGLEAMKVDHFWPQSRYQQLRLAWENLYYSCDVCNNRKRDYPNATDEGKGYQFVDVCREETNNHFQLSRESATGEYCVVTHLTDAAGYTIRRLQFNRRPFLRGFWREIHAAERRLLGLLKSAVELQNQIGAGDYCANELIEDLHDELDRIRALRPFPLET